VKPRLWRGETPAFSRNQYCKAYFGSRTVTGHRAAYAARRNAADFQSRFFDRLYN